MKLKTRIRSRLMGFMASDFKRNSLRLLARTKRRLSGQASHVLYFHQVDDPYSHLVIQKLAELQNRYSLRWIPHLVSAPLPAFQGDVNRFREWALVDAKSVAADYDTHFPAEAQLPTSGAVAWANQLLASCLDSDTFVRHAEKTGHDLWSGKLQQENCDDSDSLVRDILQRGNTIRQSKGHYLGAMFYFEGEWYWGLDRLYLLEDRLQQMGYAKQDADATGTKKPEACYCVPRPIGESATGLNASGITLEYFPSLRSPYTAVGHQRVMDLVKRSGVTLKLRPVMPMMMRGVPAPRQKQLYIISDSKRESVAAGVRFQNFVDPLGEPVKRAFSLYPWVTRQGKAEVFVAAYLRAAWADGVDICSDSGLRLVIESVGLTWENAVKELDNDEWEPLLERNVQAMLAENLWGVPSFRVTGGHGSNGGSPATSFACWGQDRIWRVESEITRRMRSPEL